jgi:hypothetical protein
MKRRRRGEESHVEGNCATNRCGVDAAGGGAFLRHVALRELIAQFLRATASKLLGYYLVYPPEYSLYIGF